MSNRKRFLFGCCSLTSLQPRKGRQLFDQLMEAGYRHPTIFVPPKPGYECVTDNAEDSWSAEVKIPSIFSTYLSIGARVCSFPAIDRLFKTIDFLVLFDIQMMALKAERLFFAKGR
jgi:putative hemolysin